MILSDLLLSKKYTGNYFFFAADSEYFELYGKALALSLLKHAPWATIHIHFYNQEPSQAAWCNKKSITFNPKDKSVFLCWIVDDVAIIDSIKSNTYTNNKISLHIVVNEEDEFFKEDENDYLKNPKLRSFSITFE